MIKLKKLREALARPNPGPIKKQKHKVYRN